jgi:hypothetical protein
LSETAEIKKGEIKRLEEIESKQKKSITSKIKAAREAKKL